MEADEDNIIPIFDGNKSTNQGRKAAFTDSIDQAPATLEYKLLQLRKHQTGEELECIDNLEHSAGAHEASKNRLERKFGGLSRRLTLYTEQLEVSRSIQYGNANDLAQFIDLLDVTVIDSCRLTSLSRIWDSIIACRTSKKTA